MPPLKSNRLILREWRDDDLEAFARLVENPVVMEYLLPMKDRAAIDAMALHIRDHFTNHGFGYLVVELPGISSFIGMVGLVRVTYAAHFTPAIEIDGALILPIGGKAMLLKPQRSPWMTASIVSGSRKSSPLPCMQIPAPVGSWIGSV